MTCFAGFSLAVAAEWTWKSLQCFQELAEDQAAFFYARRCNHSFRAAVDWQRYYARVRQHVDARTRIQLEKKLPTAVAICAPGSCGVEEVGGFLVLWSLLEGFDLSDPFLWLRLDTEVIVKFTRESTAPKAQEEAPIQGLVG